MEKKKKNYNPHSEKFDLVSEKISYLTSRVASTCLAFDLLPPGDTGEYENFVELLELIMYCTEHKLYHVRDNAISKAIEDLKS